MSKNKAENTEASSVEMDLDNFVLEQITASGVNIITPSPKIINQKPKETDLDFLNKNKNTSGEEEEEEETPEEKAARLEAERLAGETEEEEEEEEEEEGEKSTLEEALEEVINPEQNGGKGGRPVLSKDLLIDVVGQLAQDGTLALFDDGKELKDYTKEDLTDLIRVNLEEREKKLEDEIPVRFFDSLPPKLQYAAKYVADGGTDLDGLFSDLLKQERLENINIDTEIGQKAVVRQHLEMTQFGTAEEIEEEIAGLADRKELAKKAAQFKPKLEARNQEILDRKIKNQEKLRQQHQEAVDNYVSNVYETLKTGELNGIKMDKKVQAALYAGLVRADYKSHTGQPVNQLGHLLEQYQVIKPNHALIAEVLWHLSDPDGFKAKLKETGEKEATKKTVRALKTEQHNRSTGNSNGENENGEQKRNQTQRTISRPAPAKFARQ
jgi:hypothetical protein